MLARRALLRVAPKARWGNGPAGAAGVLRSCALTVRPDGSLAGTLDVDAWEGLADSGELAEDLTDLFVALGEAARDHHCGVVFLFDEVQFLAQADLEALISALHKTVQRKLPVTVVAAGLPQIPRLAGEARSYSKRLFRFPEIGRLDGDAAGLALTDPAQAAGVSFVEEAVEAVVDYTSGYPYLLQEYGKAAWDESTGPRITVADVAAAQTLVEVTLDANSFWVRTERTTEAELAYLRAMAELGDGPARESDVAAVMGGPTESVGPIRYRPLI